MDNGYVLSVTKLNEYVNSMLKNDMLLSGLSVRGEISGLKRHSSGHVYFSLKDESALIRCVMFRQYALTTDFDALQDGASVTVQGSVSVYVRDGQYQFYATRIEQFGEGDLYRRFTLLKSKLEAEGLFDASHKKPLPTLPRCIGVVTSGSGAALHDIITVTRRRFPSMDILLCPANVQGVGAAHSIAEAIRTLGRNERADVIIVGRGGGSIEDLWAFNEEEVARSIYECRVPIVSAVGHETDFTIADFVADIRAATPSAAAELCVPEYDSLMYAISELRTGMDVASGTKLDALGLKLANAGKMLQLSSPKAETIRRINTLEAMRKRIDEIVTHRISGTVVSVNSCVARLDELSPLRIIRRGFATVNTLDGQVLKSINEINAGDRLSLYMKDGNALVTVDSLEEKANAQ